jgi:hypothetical protein
MRSSHVRVDDIAKEHVIKRVGVAQGVDAEGVPDTASVEDKLLPVRSDNDDGSPGLDGSDLDDVSFEGLVVQVLEEALGDDRRGLAPSCGGWDRRGGSCGVC